MLGHFLLTPTFRATSFHRSQFLSATERHNFTNWNYLTKHPPASIIDETRERLEVLTMMKIEIVFFWIVTLCSDDVGNQCFRAHHLVEGSSMNL
jgi:hypothetical protein